MTSVELQGRVADSLTTAGPHPGWYLRSSLERQRFGRQGLPGFTNGPATVLFVRCVGVPHCCLEGCHASRAIPDWMDGVRCPSLVGQPDDPEMDRAKAFEVAKTALRETFDPEGHKNYSLEGWEDRHDCWLVLLSTVSFQPEGTPGHTLSQLLGGRRTYYKVAVEKFSGGVQSVQPVPNPYAVAQPTDT